MTHHRLLVPLLAAGALAASGCGDKKLDTGKLEGKIKDGIQKQAGVRIRTVDCPDDVKVTQQDDEGNVNYQVGG